MLAQHLLQDLWRGHGQALGGEGLDGLAVQALGGDGLDGLAVLAILYSEFCPPDVVELLRGGRGRSLMPGEGLIISHGLRPQGSQVPFRPSLEAGLDPKQNLTPMQMMSSGRAGQHTLSQHEESGPQGEIRWVGCNG